MERRWDLTLYPKVYCEKCKQKVNIAHEYLLFMHMESVHRICKCPECDFCSESERGRNIHKTKNHSKTN